MYLVEDLSQSKVMELMSDRLTKAEIREHLSVFVDEKTSPRWRITPEEIEAAKQEIRDNWNESRAARAWMGKRRDSRKELEQAASKMMQ